METMKRLLVLAVICTAMLLASGCAKKEPQKAVASLPSNPSTGYSWKVYQTNEIFDITSEFVPGESNALGAGGYDRFTLVPTGSGETSVMFLYGRSWEEDPESRLTYNVKIDKNLQIKVESFSGELPGSMEQMPDIPQFEIE